MKTTNYIWSFDLKSLLLLSMLIMAICSCDVKEETPDKKIFKAKPIDRIVPKIEEPKREVLPRDSSVVPSDSLQKIMKDTTESLHHLEKKPEIKISRRFFYLNIHKKALVT